MLDGIGYEFADAEHNRVGGGVILANQAANEMSSHPDRLRNRRKDDAKWRRKAAGGPARILWWWIHDYRRGRHCMPLPSSRAPTALPQPSVTQLIDLTNRLHSFNSGCVHPRITFGEHASTLSGFLGNQFASSRLTAQREFDGEVNVVCPV